MQLLRRKPDGDDVPEARRSRAWRLGDLLPFRSRNDNSHAETPWGDSRVPASSPGDWDATNLRAAQLIWGHALLGPCSSDELAALAGWLKPSRGTRIAVLGAGLGGLALALSRICRCRVTGFEQAEVLLRLCPDRNHGHLRSLESITIRTERSFDHAIVDGLGHRAGDIAPLMRPAAALVSRRGSVIVRAYHIADAETRSQRAYLRWHQSEPVNPHIPTRPELLRQIERTGFIVTDERAVPDLHVAAIETRWTPAVELVRLLHGKQNHQEVIPALIAEAERWRARAELIRGGRLSVIELRARRSGAD